MARFKGRSSQMIVLAPDNRRTKNREIDINFEPATGIFWVTIKGDSEAKGFVFGILYSELENTVLYGAPREEIVREVEG